MLRLSAGLNFPNSSLTRLTESGIKLPLLSYHTSSCPNTVVKPYHTKPHESIPKHTKTYHTIPYHTITNHTIQYQTISDNIKPYLVIPNHSLPVHTIPNFNWQYQTITDNSKQYHTGPNSVIKPSLTALDTNFISVMWSHFISDHIVSNFLTNYTKFTKLLN